MPTPVPDENGNYGPHPWERMLQSEFRTPAMRPAESLLDRGLPPPPDGPLHPDAGAKKKSRISAQQLVREGDMRWEVRVAGDGWEESAFGATVDEALAGVNEMREYPRVTILYVANRLTDERWELGWSFPWREPEDRPNVELNRIIEPGDARTFVIDVHDAGEQYLWSGSGGVLTATRLWREGSFPDVIEMRQPVMVASPEGGHIRLMVQHQPDDGDSDIAALCLKATKGYEAGFAEVRLRKRLSEALALAKSRTPTGPNGGWRLQQPHQR